MAKRRKKTEKVYTPEQAAHSLRLRSLLIAAVCGFLVFIPLFFTLWNIMITNHDVYKDLATESQTKSWSTSALRGTIYDRNMNALAMSVSVKTVFIDPKEIKREMEEEENHENALDLIAAKLSAMFDVTEEEIREMAEDTDSQYKVIAKKVEEDVCSELQAYLDEHDLTGVYMEEDSKRYYPNGALGAQLLGFVSGDNVGTEGLEAEYDSTLSGTAGKTIQTTGNSGTEMLYQYEKLYEATDGMNIVMTVDSTVQYYLENNLQDAVDQYDVLNGAFGIVMDVNTGEILAMATLGSYDPNNYLEIYDTQTAAELETIYENAISHTVGTELYTEGLDAYNAGVAAARLAQWRNRCISDGYEPGSTFKLITLAAALEEGTTTIEDSFYCGGTMQILGRDNELNCWKSGGHGEETTAQALQNSCNIAFANIGLSLGGEKLYDYVEAFGLMEYTGIDLPGESLGLFHSKELLSSTTSHVDLTTTAFGQSFKVTPIQLVRAIAAIVNGGYLLQPYIISEIQDSDGNVVSRNEKTVLRQVISEETSAIMCELMETVVTEGTAGNAKVAGYRIGGKTGTSEKLDEYDEYGNIVEDKFVSFVGVAPIDDPQYICLIVLDTPNPETGYYISGGIMAAPVCRDVFSEVLPYLGVEPTYSEEDIMFADMTVPNVIGKTESDAAALLTEQHLTYRTVGDGDTVTQQVPVSGTAIPGNSEVVLYMGESAPMDLLTVPDLTGCTVSQASYYVSISGQLYLKCKGATMSSSAVATTQSPAAGSKVSRGTVITVEFTDMTARD